MRTTLVVCESPWSTAKGRLERWSVRPFVEGLCELYDARLVYRTFTTRQELVRLLNCEAIDTTNERIVVYLACHGRGGRLELGRRLNSDRPNLGSVARYLRPGVEGVWLGACDVGGSKALGEFLKTSGAVWAGGYVCAVDWAPSLILDLAVIQDLIRGGRVNRRNTAKLGRAIRVFARDKLPGSRPKDVSADLRQRRRW
jgi:hypothetical protein